MSTAELHLLPDSTSSAPKNMALDLMLLEDYETKDVFRLRHYSWEGDCFTFGYSQNYNFVDAQTQGLSKSLIRRPSGGGLVDHRNDWTYAFVIPEGHELHRGKAEEAYKRIHDAIAIALTSCGQDAALHQPGSDITPGSAMGLCFAGPEPFDVVHKNTFNKIAGAAMKRNKFGLLLQGSIDKLSCPLIKDWTQFKQEFLKEVTELFNVKIKDISKPEILKDSRLEELSQRFSLESWNKKR